MFPTGIIRLKIDCRIRWLQMKQRIHRAINTMVARFVAYAVHVEPGHVLAMTKSSVGRVIDEGGVQLSERRRTVRFKVIGQRIIKLFRGETKSFGDPVKVNATE